MSAIWGRINKVNGVSKENAEAMNLSMNKFRFDRTDVILSDNVFMACGHQYYTPEDESDISPIRDNNLYFAGTCFLYNREEVIAAIAAHKDFSSLNVKEELSAFGDVRLAFCLYRLVGLEFAGTLRGAFSFAIYDSDSKLLHLVVDHFAQRYLAYYTAEDYVCFGSVYDPIKVNLGSSLKVNYEFVENSMVGRSPINFSLPDITIYKDIIQVECSCCVTINPETGKAVKTRYWDPVKTTKRIKGKTPEYYKELFLASYRKVVTSQLRSKDNTGIMLSGGLDSASVAAFAAPLLKSEGRDLYSYTSVPAKDYEVRTNKWSTEDEAYLIEEQKEYYGNIIPRYISSEGDSCVSISRSAAKLFDLPVKATLNSVNILNMCSAAQADNCSVLLSGGNGNGTISYGSNESYAVLCLSGGHPVKGLKYVNLLCKKYNLSRKRYYKGLLRQIWDYRFSKPEENYAYLPNEAVKTCHLEHNTLESIRAYGTDYYVTQKQKKNYMYMPLQYRQKSYYYTILGLTYGFILRDPSLTVEMVELALALPDECFVHDGVDRQLIRDYMRGLMPDSIVDFKKPRGIQAADFAFRVNRDWDKLKEDAFDILSEPMLREYLDGEKIDELIERLKKAQGDISEYDACDISQLGALGYFLRDYKEYTGK